MYTVCLKVEDCKGLYKKCKLLRISDCPWLITSYHGKPVPILLLVPRQTIGWPTTFSTSNYLWMIIQVLPSLQFHYHPKIEGYTINSGPLAFYQCDLGFIHMLKASHGIKCVLLWNMRSFFQVLPLPPHPPPPNSTNHHSIYFIIWFDFQHYFVISNLCNLQLGDVSFNPLQSTKIE